MKILLIRLSSLGDIILTQPVLAAVCSHYPQADIHFLTKPGFIQIVSAFPQNIKILPWQSSLQSLQNLAACKYDLVIDLHNKPNTALIRAFCRPKNKAVYNKKHALRRRIVQHKTTQTISSTLELYCSVLLKLGITAPDHFPILVNPGPDHQLLQRHKLQPKKFLLIFPGATSFTKRWPAQHFAELINLLANKYQIALAGTDRDIASQIKDKVNANLIDLTGQTSLNELVRITASAQAVIANDSGPAHLAAALSIPQVTIFGGTSPALGFAPLNPKGKICTLNLPCSPCSLHGKNSCPLHHFNCLNNLLPTQVAQTLLATIN